MIKKSFKFLNTLCLCSQDKIMFFGWQPIKIDRAIIGLDSIQVMYMPAFQQRFAMYLFPDKKMFSHITQFSCSRVGWIPYKNITIAIYNPSTFPINSGMRRTLSTSFRTLIHWTTTKRARYFQQSRSASLFQPATFSFCPMLWKFFISFLRSTMSTSLPMPRNRYSTINTIWSMFCSPFANILITIHKYIIPIYHLNSKYKHEPIKRVINDTITPELTITIRESE